MPKYQVGVVGCGVIARHHGRAYQGLDNVEIVAAADISKESVEKYASEFSVKARYTDYHEMLEKEDLDIVSVCTWQGTHADVTITAAENGVKGIMCEKPMCVSLGEADAMIEACDKNGAKLVVCHAMRFDPVNIEARKQIKGGIIGQPTLITRRVGPDSGLLNWGTHVIDITRYVLSDPKTEWVIGQVQRKTDRYERRCRIEELCMGLVCFEGGARFVLEMDMPGPQLNKLLVYGTEGILTTDGGSLLYLNDKKEGWQKIEPAKESASQWTELIDWMEGKIEGHRTDGRQARHTMEIMMAIYESLRIKGLVHMPLETKESPLFMMIDDGTLPVEKPGKYDIRVPF